MSQTTRFRASERTPVSPSSRNGTPSAPWLAFAVATLALAVHVYRLQPWMLDDAFISFRYAENFARGAGLVYNVGERVEGYTCFLWVFLLGLAGRLGLDLVLTAKVLGFVFSAGSLALLAASSRRLEPAGGRAAAIAVLVLGTCGVFTPWAASGAEIPLFAFLVLLSLLSHLWVLEAPRRARRRVWLGLVLALVTLTRPEGMLLVALVGADLLARSLRRGRVELLVPPLVFVAIYGPYFLWRWSYYGFLLPNTFYAKVGTRWEQIERGVDYALQFGRVALPLLVVVAAALLRGGRSPLRRAYLLPVTVAVYAIYVVAVGGDSMPAYRFFAPVVPVLCLAVGLGAVALTRRRLLLAALTAVLVAANLYGVRYDEEIRDLPEQDPVARIGEEIGRWLRAHADPHAVLATNTGGTIPFFSGLRTIDMLGLNDVHIAHRQIPTLGRGWAGHEKGDGAYVLSRRPDYIQFGSSWGSRDPVFRSDREIASDPRFPRAYELRLYRTDSGLPFFLYRRIDSASP